MAVDQQSYADTDKFLCLDNSSREQTGSMVYHFIYLARVVHRRDTCTSCVFTLQLQTATDAADADGMLLENLSFVGGHNMQHSVSCPPFFQELQDSIQILQHIRHC